MAHLLGHRGCMESLRADLRDLQAAIADVCSRAGAVRFPSWKFPDKVSCDLDISVLLQRYRHSDSDPEFSQHAHVVLLELVIDRLLLLLQSFTGYAETLLSGRAVPPTRGLGPCMSAGLTARTFWSTMLKLGAFCQQLRDECFLPLEKYCRWEIPAQQSTRFSTPQAGKYQKEHLKSFLPDVLESGTAPEGAQSTSVCLCPSVHVLGSSGSFQPRAGSSRAQSTRSVPTQTPGSPLASCDTCSSAQASLHEVGRAIISICQSQNIPSALSKFQEALEDSAGRRNLSATDMSYWAAEQSKDLSRINKHLQGLLQQVNPVKAELEKMGKQKEKLQKQVEDFSRKLQAEKDTQAEQQRNAEQSLKAKEKEHSEAVARLERDKDDLRRGAALLEEQLLALKEELEAKQVSVQELAPPSLSSPPRCSSFSPVPSLGHGGCVFPELSKTILMEEMRTTMVARKEMLELEEKVQALTDQRDSLEQKLSATSVQLEKEKVRVESMFRHQESLQAKQRTLLQQLDSLDQEREELQASLGEAEENKARLAEQLEQSREQSGKQLQAQQELLDTLQQEKLALEQSILELQANISRLEEQAQELRERERLLVFFPDLHVPTEMHFESSGNLTEDMESQLQANNIRIEVLERENAQLEALLAKVKAAAEQGVLKVSWVPQGWVLCTPKPLRGPQTSSRDAGRAKPRLLMLLGGRSSLTGVA
ncbi:PREDICTED: coiled-coil domain-containing protein 157 [Sturnus vulgaris]|uniref:coiled-coil domain-containing protein 157 n=1 Tax=Sturnus vulgaris TaxID=9172 RepID=UPI00071A0ACD|nr:PREDICTED: coiled-coil domain-containing protein 157 [Sturnus vulgaris]